jgi:hypothetical protein
VKIANKNHSWMTTPLQMIAPRSHELKQTMTMKFELKEEELAVA